MNMQVAGRIFKKQVVIVERSTPQYREKFFRLLRSRLSEKGIELHLLYGEQNKNKRNDFMPIEWAAYKPNKTFTIGSLTLIWSPIYQDVKKADLVILNQHNTQLVNYILLALRLFAKSRKIAFWDHGMNMQKDSSSIANRFKLSYQRACDWWFAYTAGTKRMLERNGFPPEKITVVENSIDTLDSVSTFRSITPEEKNKLRHSLQISNGDQVAIYCGALTKEKKLDFLIAAADAVRMKNDAFKLIIVGDGPDKELIKQACVNRPWISWVGAKFGREKALYFSIAHIFMIPALIGLAVLDSFSFECPIVTTNNPFHGPEFEYLENGITGVITEDKLDSYVAGTTELLSNSDKLKKMKENCMIKANEYTIEKMVDNFALGVEQALS